MLMQVLSLTPDQINALAPGDRETLVQLVRLAFVHYVGTTDHVLVISAFARNPPYAFHRHAYLHIAHHSAGPSTFECRSLTRLGHRDQARK